MSDYTQWFDADDDGEITQAGAIPTYVDAADAPAVLVELVEALEAEQMQGGSLLVSVVVADAATPPLDDATLGIDAATRAWDMASGPMDEPIQTIIHGADPDEVMRTRLPVGYDRPPSG